MDSSNEITYDLILEYLVGYLHSNNLHSNNTHSVNTHSGNNLHSNKHCVNNAVNIQSDILKSNFEFKDYFPYKKIGVIKNNSFISSILYLIEDNYKLLSEDEQNKQNIIFLNQLKSKWNSLKKINNNTNITKEEGINIILNNDYEKIIPIICNVLELNIIVLDFENNKFSVESENNKINKYKGFLLMAKYKNNYEPIINGDKKIFCYSELNKEVQEIIEDRSYTNDEILKVEGYSINKDNNFKVNLDDYNKTKLNKMKKDQLINLIEMLKLNVNEKDTKNTIIELILSQKK
jgi:hypothetical protein